MSDHLIEATGPLPVEQVWQAYACPGRWSQWAPQIRRVSGFDGQLRVGSVGRVLGPAGLRVRGEILSVDADARRWSWRVSRGPFRVVMEHGVDPHGTGSRAWVRIAAPRVLVRVYRPLARAALRRLCGG